MPTYKVTFREATGETREETVGAESHGEALAKAGPARAEESVEIREDEWGNTGSIEESTDAPRFKVQGGLLAAPAAILTQSRRLGCGCLVETAVSDAAKADDSFFHRLDLLRAPGFHKDDRPVDIEGQARHVAASQRLEHELLS